VEFTDIVNGFGQFASFCVQRAVGTLTSPSSRFSLLSLGCALLIATLFLRFRRSPAKRIRLRVLLRALLPQRWYRSPSARADFGLMAMNLFLTGLIFGWALLSADAVEHFLTAHLHDSFGEDRWIVLPHYAAMAVLTLAFYLAFEFAYFIDHYLSHHIPVLWHFHRVHHTAETLSPVTVFRVHPLDTIIFYNLTALCVGTTLAVVKLIVGSQTGQFGVGGYNAILLASLYLVSHLHHSEMWIAFNGKLGRVILSPAHHQIHHSANPVHFNRNFGNTLAVFDWVAGSLYVPPAKRERLSFGAGSSAYDLHSASGLLIMPFVEVVQAVIKQSPPDAQTEIATLKA
jgi:sterol desaturase/sphingolipid hydroxylase (fatty acid hydroxylase superfamily)